MPPTIAMRAVGNIAPRSAGGRAAGRHPNATASRPSHYNHQIIAIPERLNQLFLRILDAEIQRFTS